VRLAKVEADQLFGIFDHRIPLNLDERITIVHGPNGYGKTVMLRLVSAFFSRNNTQLRSVPFTKFTLSFDDGSRVVVEKKARPSNGKKATDSVSFRLLKRGVESKEYTLPERNAERLSIPLSYIEHEVRGLERIGLQLWRSELTGEELGIDDLLERYPDRFPPSSAESLRTRPPKWLTDLRSSIPTHFIEAHRLFVQPKIRASREADRRPAQEQAVKAYAEELSKTIETKLADYASLSQSLDRTFPVRVVGEQSPPALTAEALRNELTELERRRIELRAAGLLDTSEDVEVLAPAEIDDRTKALLAVYVNDTRQKLSVFDDLAAKTELLKEVLNQRFLNKTLEISRESGLALHARDGRSIPLTVLSSGEQHELVLLYELLFNVQEGSLILLDEPELSLHVAWQEAFLRDLLRIADLRQLDVLVATHSPQIINDRWDLTVELSGPDRH
jgi:ABC-type Mn2+/Zn2+ transport system ATPase subunit